MAYVFLYLYPLPGSSVTDFMPQLTGLDANKYTVICFDPQGYGRSRPPDRNWPLLFLQRDAHDAAALMKVLFTLVHVRKWECITHETIHV